MTREINTFSTINPTVGRIVHFVLGNGKHRPGMILDVPDNLPWGVVDLIIFPHMADTVPDKVSWRFRVPYDAVLGLETWHWPERD